MLPSRDIAITFVHLIYRLPCSRLYSRHLDPNPISGQVNCGASPYLYF